MSRLKSFYTNYNIKRVNILFKNMNIYLNTCSLQEHSKDSETGQINLTFPDWRKNQIILQET